MSDFLLAGLGLDNVSGDPTDIPIGTWDGDISQSNLVLTDGNNDYPPGIAHAVTFRVTEGDKAGAKKTQWFNLGSNPKTAEGTPATSIDQVASFEPTMSEKAKEYYKQMWLKLGVPENEVGRNVKTLEGRLCTFRVYESNGRKNATVDSTRQPGVGSTPTATPGASSTPMPF
jgi:hypothetical protein